MFVNVVFDMITIAAARFSNSYAAINSYAFNHTV